LRVAALYDVHGKVHTLDAVLEDVDGAQASGHPLAAEPVEEDILRVPSYAEALASFGG
jgi:hypothetical protein